MFLRTLCGTCLIFCLLAAGSQQTNAAVQVEKTPYNGWQEAFTLSNGKVEAVVVPDIAG